MHVAVMEKSPPMHSKDNKVPLYYVIVQKKSVSPVSVAFSDTTGDIVAINIKCCVCRVDRSWSCEGSTPTITCNGPFRKLSRAMLVASFGGQCRKKTAISMNVKAFRED